MLPITLVIEKVKYSMHVNILRHLSTYLLFQTCQKIRDFANKVHLNTKEVIEAVKEAILEGARDPQAVLKKAIDFLKAQLSCENVIGKEVSFFL